MTREAQRETILQLGAGAWMKWTIRRLRGLGYRVFAADKTPNAPAFAEADGHAPIDIVDAAAIEAYAREIGADLVMVVNGAGVISGAQASARLGLPALPVEVAVRSQDKGLCRDAWKAAGLAQPAYRVVDAVDAIAEAADEIGYPVVVKPTRRWGSRGVSLLPDASHLDEALALLRAEAGPADGTKYIVEAQLFGTELSVEGLVQNGHVQILAAGDKVMQDHPVYRVGMILNYPAAIRTEQEVAVERTISAAIRAMGIENGAFDAECIVSDDAVSLIEINPRPGGGHIFGQIVEAVSGVCMPEAYVKILLGQPTDMTPKQRHGVCYKFFNAPGRGVFHGVSGLDEARRMPGVLDMAFEMATGTRVRPIAADADRHGFVVAEGADREDAIRIADHAIASLRFEMTPGQE